MSDIRTFFSSGKKPVPSSTLSNINEASSPKSAPKETVLAKTSKKRPEKITPTKKSKQRKNEEIVELSESDGENPIPKSVRKPAATRGSKRKAHISDSDSDTFVPPKSKATKAVTTTPSKEKNTTRHRQVIVSSDSDASPPRKSTNINLSASDEEDIIELALESDEDPIPSKRPRKKLLPGQKKLELKALVAKKETKTSKAPSSFGLKPISTDDFWNNGGFSKGKKTEPKKMNNISEEKGDSSVVKRREKSSKKTTVIDEDEFVEERDAKRKKEEVHKKKSKISEDDEIIDISPVKKENSASPKDIKQRTSKKIVVEDEFMEEMDKIPKKKTDIPLKTKQTTKEKDSDSEFIESDDEIIIPKKNKITPPCKENLPSKSQKSFKKAEKGKDCAPLVKPPTFIAGTPASIVKDDKTYELPWVDKYKPTSLSQLVGQHGEKSPMNKLLDWLKDWSSNNLGEGGKVKKSKPAPWQQGGDGTAYKAALLSGTPGVGKTTCAQLACNTLGLSFVEMNASDVRNKKHLEAQVAHLTGSHQINEYFGQKATTNHDDNEIHHVLIMDEVDGMSGNEDRAGISELIQIIKETKIPIICICNDRSLPKMRSLVNYCYDLRFPRPRVEQIRGRIMSIAAQEKVKLDKNQLDELIELSGHDVRQTIYNLQMHSMSDSSKIEQKDSSISTFEATKKLLSRSSTWAEKQEMFFVDYGIMPLFVQENYLNMRNKGHTKKQTLKGIREAAELISLGDTVDRCIRSSGAWKLLNEQAMFSSILPSIAIDGSLSSMIQFPAWLGKNSTAGKRKRLMRQVASHAHLKITADTHSLVTDYVPALRRALTEPLIMHENDGIPDVVAVMNEYDLIKDDAEAIGELAVWPGKIDPASKIQSKVKAALTRTLNKEHRTLPYHLDDITKGRKKAAGVAELEIDEEGNLVERIEGEPEAEEPAEEEEGADNPGVIIAKPKPARGAASARGSTRGRGKK